LPSINTGVAVLSGVTLAPEAKSGRIEFKATISAGASSLNGILLLKMNRRTAFQWKFSSSGPRLAADARTTIHGQKKNQKRIAFALAHVIIYLATESQVSASIPACEPFREILRQFKAQV